MVYKAATGVEDMVKITDPHADHSSFNPEILEISVLPYQVDGPRGKHPPSELIEACEPQE